MVRGADGHWRFPEPIFPLMFSLRARFPWRPTSPPRKTCDQSIKQTSRPSVVGHSAIARRTGGR
jgi:hypothetical protein